MTSPPVLFRVNPSPFYDSTSLTVLSLSKDGEGEKEVRYKNKNFLFLMERN